jgi:hypothetical protein
MDKKDKIDKTKEKLGLDKLEENEKKEIFNKFVKAGGKVIDDKQKRRVLAIDREKQKQFREKIDSRKMPAKPQSRPQFQSSARSSGSQDSASLSGFFARFKIRLKLRFMKIAKSGGFYFHRKFFKRFYESYRTALIELQLLYLEMFKKNISVGNSAINKLDSIKVLYYELLEMTGELYSKILIDQITEHYTSFSNVPKKVLELREPLMELYRKLYVLKAFENTILNSFETAAQIYKQIDDGKNQNFYSLQKKIDSNLFIIFHKLYPSLHLLFCHFNGRMFDELDPEIGMILNIRPEEQPGNRIKQNTGAVPQPSLNTSPEPEETELDGTIPDKPEESGPSGKDDLPRFIKIGLKMIHSLDITEKRKAYDKSKIFEDIAENDKIFTVFMLFSDFDREFSALLTTGKIKYLTDFADRSASDYKQKMLLLYDSIRDTYELFKDYTEATSRYQKMRLERPIGSSGYIDYTKKLDELHGKRINSGKLVRMKVKAFMENVSETSIELLRDIKNENKFIDNPDDILQFNTAVEGNDRINGRSIKEAITIMYCYASALVHRLSSGDDLGGDIEFKDDQSRNNNSSPQKTASAPETDMLLNEKGNTAADKPENNKTKSEGVLDELTDMIG